MQIERLSVRTVLVFAPTFVRGAAPVFALVLALVVFAPESVRAQGVRVKLPAWPDLVLLDSMRQEHFVDGKPEVVYAAVLKVFDELGIPVGNTDSKLGIIGSERFERTRTLAGATMSRSFSCGESATGPTADAYRISIAIAVWVKPGERLGTAFATAIAASGTDITGVQRNPRECASTGRIETKILEGVQKYVK